MPGNHIIYHISLLWTGWWWLHEGLSHFPLLANTTCHIPSGKCNISIPYIYISIPYIYVYIPYTNTTRNNLSSLSSPDDYKRPLKTWHLLAALAVYLALLALLLLHILTLLASADTSGTPASADKDNDTVAEAEDQAATHGGCAGWPQYSNARRCAMQLTTHVT